MKKLLLLLFSLLLSFNSYGEWTPLSLNNSDDIFYLDLERTKAKDGYVYYWYLKEFNEPEEGVSSVNTYIQGDCELNKFKGLSFNLYGGLLKEQELIISQTPENPQWNYYPPNSVGETLLEIVCDLEDAWKVSEKEYNEYVETLMAYSKYLMSDIKEEAQAKLTDEQKNLQASWVGSVAEKVKSNWRYQGAEDDWWCEVYIQQKANGEVVEAEIERCGNVRSNQEQSFKNSILRAVYKSSPLSPMDVSIFEAEIKFVFFVN